MWTSIAVHRSKPCKHASVFGPLHCAHTSSIIADCESQPHLRVQKTRACRGRERTQPPPQVRVRGLQLRSPKQVTLSQPMRTLQQEAGAMTVKLASRNRPCASLWHRLCAFAFEFEGTVAPGHATVAKLLLASVHGHFSALTVIASALDVGTIRVPPSTRGRHLHDVVVLPNNRGVASSVSVACALRTRVRRSRRKVPTDLRSRSDATLAVATM